MTIRHERVTYPPRGLLGGESGTTGLDLVNGIKIPAKSQVILKPNDTVTFQTPSGGGMFSSDQRDPQRITKKTQK